MGSSISESRNSFLTTNICISIKNNRNTNIFILHCCVPIEDLNIIKCITKRIFLVHKYENVIINMFSNISNYIYIYDRIIESEMIIQKIKEAQYLKNETIIDVY